MSVSILDRCLEPIVISKFTRRRMLSAGPKGTRSVSNRLMTVQRMDMTAQYFRDYAEATK